MRRLLILDCSATKTKSAFAVPTYRRYDGPLWQTLRAAGIRTTDDHAPEASEVAGEVHVYALSAEHGLIPLHSCIHDYDRRMTVERAAELRAGGAWQLRNRVLVSLVRGEPPYDDALIVAGATYVAALDLAAFAEARVPVRVAGGGIGVKRATLRRWLRDEPLSDAYEAVAA